MVMMKCEFNLTLALCFLTRLSSPMFPRRTVLRSAWMVSPVPSRSPSHTASSGFLQRKLTTPAYALMIYHLVVYLENKEMTRNKESVKIKKRNETESEICPIFEIFFLKIFFFINECQDCKMVFLQPSV